VNISLCLRSPLLGYFVPILVYCSLLVVCMLVTSREIHLVAHLVNLSLCQAIKLKKTKNWFSTNSPTLVNMSSLRIMCVHELTRVNSTSVLDEELRIGRIGRRMNSNVKISQTKHVSRINVVVNLAYSQSVPDRPLLAPIYRWPGLKEPVGSKTYYNVCI
jgi:hypothetical protein